MIKFDSPKIYYVYKQTEVNDEVKFAIKEMDKNKLHTFLEDLRQAYIAGKFYACVVEEIGGDYSCYVGNDINTDNIDGFERENAFVNWIRYYKDVEPENIN